ncbi:hypothetical protein [Carnobacterium jeotgali]|nr:hypothetical protein [Carnobacterium jeotgali]
MRLKTVPGLLQANPSIPKEFLEAATLFDEEPNKKTVQEIS